MGNKTVKFNKEGINQLPNNKPVVYRIKNRRGVTNYVGKAKKGNIRKEISSYLGKIPGSEVEQFSSVKEAEKKEANAIKRSKPPYNKLGK